MPSFENVNLRDVDPNQASIADKTYNQVIGKVEKKTYSNEKGQGEYISLSFIIKDDPEVSGRRVFTTIFPFGKDGKFSLPMLKQLRKLMDATGVQPEGDFDGTDSVVSYLNAVREAGATFSMPVKTADEVRNGVSQPATRPNLWEIGASI